MPLILRLLASRRRDESGSVLIAVVVVSIVSMLVVAALDAVTQGLDLTRTDQNRNNAFQFANAGVDKAVYRIDRDILPTTASSTADSVYTPGALDAAGKVTAFEETLTVGQSTYLINVSQSPAGQSTKWKVMSLGTDRPTGRQRLAVATITARSLFENGFFTINDFYLRGIQTTPVAYDSATCPTAVTSCDVTPLPGGLGTNSRFIGSNATVAAAVAAWQSFNMYGRATQAAAEGDCGLPSINSPASQAECAAAGGIVNPITDELEYPMPPLPSALKGCPPGGNFGTDGTTTFIAPGNYTCDDMTLWGTLVVDPPGIVRLYPMKNFSVDEDAVVNREKPTENFQVYYPVQTPASSSSICGGEIWGLLFTPGLEINCNGSAQPVIYGAVVANLHAGTGNQFDFHWDLAAIYAVNDGKFAVKDWRECPPGSSDC